MLIKAKTVINGIEMELQNTMDWSTYDQMWVEIGIDAEGNKYELYYEDVEGQELEDYDYDNPARIEKVEEDQEERTMKTTKKTCYEIEEERVKYDSLRKTYFNDGDGWVRDRFAELDIAKKEFADACDRYDGDKGIALNLNVIEVEYDEDGDEVDTEYVDCIERFTFDDYRKALKDKMSQESDDELKWDWEHFSGLECEIADELLTERLGEDWND